MKKKGIAAVVAVVVVVVIIAVAVMFTTGRNETENNESDTTESVAADDAATSDGDETGDTSGAEDSSEDVTDASDSEEASEDAGTGNDGTSDDGTITVDEAKLMLCDEIGTEDEDTGYSFNYGYEETVTVDGVDYYNFRMTWLVEDHSSYLTNMFVATDGSVIYSGASDGDGGWVFDDDN